MEKQNQDYSCRTCGQNFNTSEERQRHNTRLHPGNEGKGATGGQGTPDTNMGEAKDSKGTGDIRR